MKLVAIRPAVKVPVEDLGVLRPLEMILHLPTWLRAGDQPSGC
jgi:hypothetical protein